MEQNSESLFENAMARYQSGEEASVLIKDFENITNASPNQSSGWTCLAWLQLLCGENNEALRSARIAVKLNSQDPQSRINLSLALLETNSKGVRDQIEVVKQILFTVPELQKELKDTEFYDLSFPIINNIEAKPITLGVDARESLVKQVCSSVRWSETMQCIVDHEFAVHDLHDKGTIYTTLSECICDHVTCIRP